MSQAEMTLPAISAAWGRDNLRKLILPGAMALAGRCWRPVPKEEFDRILELALDGYVRAGGGRGGKTVALAVLEREFGLRDFVWVDPFTALEELDRRRAAA